MGSFRPDSSCSSADSRGGSAWPRRVLNTAAASVDAMTAPTIQAVPYDRPARWWAKKATTAAVITTPTVASTEAGARAVRRRSPGADSPPSNRITARATTAMFWATTSSSKRTRPRPSSPTTMPSTMNSRSPGTRYRLAAGVAATPMASSAAPMSRTASMGKPALTPS